MHRCSPPVHRCPTPSLPWASRRVSGSSPGDRLAISRQFRSNRCLEPSGFLIRVPPRCPQVEVGDGRAPATGQGIERYSPMKVVRNPPRGQNREASRLATRHSVTIVV